MLTYNPSYTYKQLRCDFQGIADNVWFWKTFLPFHFFIHPAPVNRYFYQTTTGFICPNDGWMSLSIQRYGTNIFTKKLLDLQKLYTA